MKEQEVLLLTDMDNTLLNTNKEISWEDREAIRAFQAAGGHFAVVTGRIPMSIARYGDEIAFLDPVVTHNGAAIYDFQKKQYLWQTQIDKEAAYSLMDRIHEKFPETAFEMYTTVNQIVYCTYDNAQLQKHIDFEKFMTETVDYHALKAPLIKVICIAEPPIIDQVIPFIREHYQKDALSFVRSDFQFYEFVNGKVDKGIGLQKLGELLHIAPENIFAVGDYYNDIAMIKQAACGIAVANAADQLKQSADIVLPVTCDESPIREVIKIIRSL